MFTLRSVSPAHLLYVEPPKDSVEHVYSAVEWEYNDESTAYPVVCYRTKDGMTHQAVFLSGEYAIRKYVKPFGK